MDQAVPAATAYRGMAWVDGAFVPANEAKVSVFDYGFSRSDVTYDVVHAWGGRLFRVEQHLDRFLASMAALRMDPGMDRAALRALVIECVARSGLRDAFVAMLCTRGRPPQGSRDLRQCRNNLIVYSVPFVWVVTPEKQVSGISAIISPIPRIGAKSVDPTVKNYHWLDLDRSLFEAYDRGADTAILLAPDGSVAEGPGFNVFIVRDGRMITPDAGALEGITRRTLLDICAEQGIPTEVRPVSREELLDADEILSCTTAGGVMPIVRIEDRILGNGAPGPISVRMRELYWARHADPAETTAVPYPPGGDPDDPALYATSRHLVPPARSRPREATHAG